MITFAITIKVICLILIWISIGSFILFDKIQREDRIYWNGSVIHFFQLIFNWPYQYIKAKKATTYDRYHNMLKVMNWTDNNIHRKIFNEYSRGENISLLPWDTYEPHRRN